MATCELVLAFLAVSQVDGAVQTIGQLRSAELPLPRYLTRLAESALMVAADEFAAHGEQESSLTAKLEAAEILGSERTVASMRRRASLGPAVVQDLIDLGRVEEAFRRGREWGELYGRNADPQVQSDGITAGWLGAGSALMLGRPRTARRRVAQLIADLPHEHPDYRLLRAQLEFLMARAELSLNRVANAEAICRSAVDGLPADAGNRTLFLAAQLWELDAALLAELEQREEAVLAAEKLASTVLLFGSDDRNLAEVAACGTRAGEILRNRGLALSGRRIAEAVLSRTSELLEGSSFEVLVDAFSEAPWMIVGDLGPVTPAGFGL